VKMYFQASKLHGGDNDIRFTIFSIIRLHLHT